MKKSELIKLIKEEIQKIKLNEFGPLYAPQIGSVRTKGKLITYPVETIKIGDKFKAIRDGIRFFSKGDSFEILDIKNAREMGSLRNSLVFFIKVNGKLNNKNVPFEIDESEIAFVLGR